ncbi:hypothetical protein D1BOALGB6SA_2107 [Olavius sp. associated proteobacterium Delta 1]|nr:hypothetical protein D1BOALGB6SA_2107 [Olavius sp. associated proteobacterium Delta 1]
MKRYPRTAWHVSSAVLPGHQLLPVPDAIPFKKPVSHSGHPIPAENSDKTGRITARFPRAC